MRSTSIRQRLDEGFIAVMSRNLLPNPLPLEQLYNTTSAAKSQ